MTRGKRAESSEFRCSICRCAIGQASFFFLRAPSSTDAPVLLLNQLNNAPHEETSCRSKLYGESAGLLFSSLKLLCWHCFYCRRSICLAVHCDVIVNDK